MSRILVLLCCFVFAFTFSGCNDEDELKSDTAVISHSVSEHTVFKYDDKSQIKVGFIYIGEIDDAGFNQSMDIARLKLIEKGYNCVYSENIPDNELCEKEMTRLINEEGVNVLVLTSYNYSVYAKKIAAVNPEIVFLQYSEEENTENLGTFTYRSYELKYLMGVAAGKKAEETGIVKIGYVAPVKTPFCYRDINAFALGVKSQCSDAEIYLDWTNSWGNYQLETNSAYNLVKNYNCGIIAYATDTTAVPEFCQSNGAYVLGNSMEVKNIAPDVCIAVGKPDYDEYVVVEIEKLLNDGWSAKSLVIGMNTDEHFTIVDIPGNCAENTAIAVDMMKNKIKNSEIEVFSGPVSDNTGIMRVNNGENLSLSDIETMQWLVDFITEV